MPRKDKVDATGAVYLTGFALLIAFNQVVIKVTNEGLQPVFFAGLRSALAALCVLAWMRWRGIGVDLSRRYWGAGLLMGTLFAVEFLLLFLALDFTAVARVSVIFYTMPVWLALAAHLLLPGERMSLRKGAGLALAVAGVALAMSGRAGEGAGLLGDLFALLAAMAWAGIALCARATRLSEQAPEMQLLWQLAVSAPILLLAATFAGPALREPALIHWAGLAFQVLAIASAGFLFWLWLLSIYPASGVASFSFISPVFGVAFGWLLLDEEVGLRVLGALALVCVALVLINRPARG